MAKRRCEFKTGNCKANALWVAIGDDRALCKAHARQAAGSLTMIARIDGTMTHLQ